MQIRLPLALAIAAVGLLLVPAGASAAFHLTKIREVHEGGAGADYVELQMYASGQNFVSSHYLVTYAGAAPFTTYQFLTGVANGQNQRTILVSDSATPMGITADFVVPGDNLFPGPDGSVGNPVLFLSGGLTPGTSIERSIAPGCPTLLEGSDDTNDSATDFAVATPSPRNNATAPTETACNGGGGGGGGGDGDGDGLDSSKTKGKQSVDNLKIKLTADQDSTLDLGGKAKVAQRGLASTAAKKKFTLKKKTGIGLQAGVKKVIGLKFKKNSKKVKQIKKLLKNSKKARKNSKVVVNLTLTTAAGVASDSKLKIKLKP